MAQEPFLVGGWLFTGERADGGAIRIQFSEVELSRANDGLKPARRSSCP